jgi:hypothetical protein
VSGRTTTHPRVYVEPIDRDERPRRYAHEFTEHEWAIAWTHHVTADHHARFGMRHGCRQTPSGSNGGNST